MPFPGRARHAPWEFPSDPNLALWRYMDLGRFVSLLKTKQLFFSRVDSLEDRFEGSFTKPHYEMRAKVGAVGPLQLELRKRVYVNCWFAQPDESTAMWKIYGGSTSSVAIRTTLGKLIEALPDQMMPGTLAVGLVDYVDHGISQVPHTWNWKNELQPFFQKNIRYQYEHELRVAIWNRAGTNDHEHPPLGGRFVGDVGLTCPIKSLSDLIEMVYINFESNEWFWEVVQDLLLKYSPSIRLQPFSEVPTPLI